MVSIFLGHIDCNDFSLRLEKGRHVLFQMCHKLFPEFPREKRRGFASGLINSFKHMTLYYVLHAVLGIGDTKVKKTTHLCIHEPGILFCKLNNKTRIRSRVLEVQGIYFKHIHQGKSHWVGDFWPKATWKFKGRILQAEGTVSLKGQRQEQS